MKKSAIQNEQGITLVELLLSTMLALLLLSAIFSLFSSSTRLSSASDCQREAQQTARIAVDAIAREAKYAKKITVVSNTCITLESKNKKITYYLDEKGILRRDKNDGSGAQPLTGESIIPLSISYLKFSYLNNVTTTPGTASTLQIILTATTTDKHTQKYSYTLQTAVTNLNK